MHASIGRPGAIALGLMVTMLSPPALAGQYAPAAGQHGSTAVHKDDPSIVGWADGYTDYVVGDAVDATWQVPAEALGPAGGDDKKDAFKVVSLGRDGRITLTFSTPIADGPGPDFAVFENAITDNFLELGFVEISSNGTDFFRFENDSKTPGTVGAFGPMDATNITGYAGKYRLGHGTPFDLRELAGTSPLLDANNVGYVRIIDIVGDGSTTDSSGDAIYDPYPTTGSAGVDLDAVAVMNAATIPEPSTALLIVAGAVAATLRRRGRA